LNDAPIKLIAAAKMLNVSERSLRNAATVT
jgi:hypothetical protein